MAGRGIYYALDEDEDRLFRALRAGDGPLAFLGVVCERIKAPWFEQTDKAWEAMHRALTDGGLHYGRSPLYRCVLGTKNYAGEGCWHFVGYCKVADVVKVAAALEPVTEDWLRERYWRIDPTDYEQPLSESDFAYTWEIFRDVRLFYARAAKAERAVVFTCDL